MESESDLIFVKEETYDDQPIGQHLRLTDNRKRKIGFIGANQIEAVQEVPVI